MNGTGRLVDAQAGAGTPIGSVMRRGYPLGAPTGPRWNTTSSTESALQLQGRSPPDLSNPRTAIQSTSSPIRFNEREAYVSFHAHPEAAWLVIIRLSSLSPLSAVLADSREGCPLHPSYGIFCVSLRTY
jgi:hypothetical protein